MCVVEDKVIANIGEGQQLGGEMCLQWLGFQTSNVVI